MKKVFFKTSLGITLSVLASVLFLATNLNSSRTIVPYMMNLILRWIKEENYHAKKKAIMIGAGLSNMAAAVYLIQEGKWSGDKSLSTLLIITDQTTVPLPKMLRMTIGIKIIRWKIKRVILLAVVVCLTTVPMLT